MFITIQFDCHSWSFTFCQSLILGHQTSVWKLECFPPSPRSLGLCRNIRTNNYDYWNEKSVNFCNQSCEKHEFLRPNCQPNSLAGWILWVLVFFLSLNAFKSWPIKITYILKQYNQKKVEWQIVQMFAQVNFTHDVFRSTFILNLDWLISAQVQSKHNLL